MSVRIIITCGLLLTFAAAGCRDDRAIERPAPEKRRLTIRNERRFAVEVRSAEDRDRDFVLLGSDAATIAIELSPARYVVSCTTRNGVVLFAAPMPDEVAATPVEIDTGDAERVAEFAKDSEFAAVPGGPALIGDILGIGQESERPAHIADIPMFLLARRETTTRDFAEFLNAAATIDDGWVSLDSKKSKITRDAAGRFQSSAPDEPIVTVSARGAEAYCAWKTQTTGIPHRLPSEKEWEKAARGPYSTNYDYGNVYTRTAANQQSGTIRATGSYAPSPWGFFDLTGNAFEWIAEPYDADAYRRLFSKDALPPASGDYRLLRGGSFILDGMYLRNSFRMRQRADVRTDDFGFRVVRELKE